MLNNAQLIDAKTTKIQILEKRVAKLEKALQRISEYEYELEGTAATWKDIATGCKSMAVRALAETPGQSYELWRNGIYFDGKPNYSRIVERSPDMEYQPIMSRLSNGFISEGWACPLNLEQE